MNKDSRQVNSIRNFTVGTFNQVLLLFLNLIAKSVFIKSLGLVFVGVNGLFTNIFLLLSFAEFGIGSVMIYSLYAPISRENKDQVAGIYHFFRRLYSWLSGVIAIVGLLFVPLLPLIVKTTQTIPYLSGYYVLYLIGVIVSNVFMYNSHMILADQKGYILSLYGLLFEGSAMVIQIVLLVVTGNYALYLIVFIFKNLLYALATRLKVNKLYPFLSQIKKVERIGEEEKRNIYTKIIDVFSYKFARVFITGTDNILISVLVGTIWVGYYSNYDLIILGVMTLVTAFYTGISASIGNLIAKEDGDRQFAAFQTVQVINMWILGFTSTSLYILFQDFISLWLGAEYLLDFGFVVLIIINYYLVCNRKALSLFREAAGMFNKIKYAMFFAAGLNIILSILLGRIMGLSGVLLGTTISALSTYYWYEAKLLIKDNFSESLTKFFIKQGEALAYTCMSIGITWLATSWIRTVTIGSFLVKILMCLTVPNIFYILVLRKKDQFKVISDAGFRYYKKIRKR